MLGVRSTTTPRLEGRRMAAGLIGGCAMINEVLRSVACSLGIWVLGDSA